MESAKVLFIGRAGIRTDKYHKALQKQYHVILATSGKKGLIQALECQPKVIILDADSMRTPGKQIIHRLVSTLPEIPLIHIISKEVPKDVSSANVILRLPLSSRRLVNAVERLLKATDDERLICGPYEMNVNQRLLNVNGKETLLNPKVALLLELFMRQPNMTIDRKTLMEKIWDTDYLGDTRTLDVHIRWVRNALEDKGRYPRYLKTVRGVGYRLEIPSATDKKQKNRP